MVYTKQLYIRIFILFFHSNQKKSVCFRIEIHACSNTNYCVRLVNSSEKHSLLIYITAVQWRTTGIFGSLSIQQRHSELTRERFEVSVNKALMIAPDRSRHARPGPLEAQRAVGLLLRDFPALLIHEARLHSVERSHCHGR